MATSWSKDTSIGSYGSKMRVRVNVVRQSLSGNYTRVKVRIYAYNGGRNSPTYNQGDGASVAVSGDASHSDQVNFRIGPRSWGTLADWEFNVPHDADGRKSFRITGKLSDTGTSALGNGGSITITGSLAPLYLTPKAPSWGATSYRSADTVKVSWNRRSSARGRYDKLRVQRWARSTGKWYHRALLSGSATSYTDTSLSSNDEHQWRVRAEGPGGTSDWVSGGTLGTMPSYPTNVHAVKDGQSVRIGWTDKAAGTNRTRTFIIADNPDGAGWVDVGTIGGSAQSWTHTDADPSVTHQYKVATQIRSQITLTSNYSAHSNVVQLQAAPKQPARLGPSDSGTWEIGDTLALQWEHLAVDTTAQTSAEVWWRIEGGDWNTTVISGAQDSFEVTPNPAGARARLEWRVRTKGAHPDWSPWSSTNGPLLSTRPLVLLQAPVHQEPLETSRLLADWTYEPGGPESQLQQSEWVATLSLHGTGTAVENQAGSTASSAELQTRLANQTEYVLQLSVRNGDGLWSEPDQSVFTTDFPLPAIVEAFPVWDQASGAVNIGFGESQELRASYQWTGAPGESTSQMILADVPGNLLDPEPTTAEWSGSGGAVLSDQPRGTRFPWLAGITETVLQVDYAGSGSKYVSPGSANRPVAVPGKWYGLAATMDIAPGVKANLRLQFTSGDTRASSDKTLPPGGGVVSCYGQAVEGDGYVWPVFRPSNPEESFTVAGVLLVEADTEDEVKAALGRYLPTEVHATNHVDHPDMGRGNPFTSAKSVAVTAEADGPDGLQGLVTADGGGTGYIGAPRFYLVPGSWLALAADIGWDDGITYVRVQTQFYDTDGEYISAPQTYWDRAEHPEAVTRVSTVTEVPEGTRETRVYLWLYSDTDRSALDAGAQVWIDHVSVTTAPTEDAATVLAGDYFDGSTPGVTDVDAIDVERRQPDGSWLRIASGIGTSSTITDRTPHIGDVEYRAVSRTVLPTEQEGPAATASWVHDRDPVFVNGSAGMDQLCLARGNEATDEHGVDQALHRFAGQSKPTAFFGPGQEYTTSFTGRILPHYYLPTSSRADWVALLRQRSLVCFRDCTGRKVFGVLSVDFAQTGNVETVNIGVQEADYVEGAARVSDVELEQRQGE
ncbi:hypothetical protein [Brachybacterium tyrofermentans]|uniref:hypothetical protein n=1 Tax=Brachybacterium tyrofermentans TaxID=47848 RepID=UPI0018668103|nr:hypothetical protein [Brachybacterium tyrofermentans]